MYRYGNLIYNEIRGWVFIEEDGEEELSQGTLVAALNYLGENGWELVVYDKDLGYLLKKNEK